MSARRRRLGRPSRWPNCPRARWSRSRRSHSSKRALMWIWGAFGDGSDQAGRTGRAQGIAVSTFKATTRARCDASEPPPGVPANPHQGSVIEDYVRSLGLGRVRRRWCCARRAAGPRVEGRRLPRSRRRHRRPALRARAARPYRGADRRRTAVGVRFYPRDAEVRKQARAGIELAPPRREVSTAPAVTTSRSSSTRPHPSKTISTVGTSRSTRSPDTFRRDDRPIRITGARISTAASCGP